MTGFVRMLRRVLMAVLLYAGASETRAAHYAGGSITWTCIGAGQYEIHLDLFLDCAGFTIIPQTITFQSDCGTTFTVPNLVPTSSQEVSQLCASQMVNSSCNGGALPGMEWYEFTTVQNLPPCDSWHVSWNICCRSNAIDLVGNQGMYIDAAINTLDAPCDNSPVFTDQSLPYVCVNQPVYYNFGVNEPDGNTLAYTLINGRFFGGTPQNLNYQGGYSGGTPVPGITVDPINGQIVFTPTMIGNYVVVMQVEEFDSNGVLIGTVMRDIVFVVIACTGNAPQTLGVVNNTGGILVGPNSIEVCDGEYFCVDVQFTDADPGTVLQVVSQATALLPGATFNIVGNNPATATICWTGDINNTPVNVLVQADDGSCPVENTASVAVNISTTDVVGVPPSPGTNGSVQVCPGSLAFFLLTELGGTPDPSGYWTAPNGTPHNAQFDPITDPAGIYTYTVGNACANATATVDVSFIAPTSAGGNGSLSVCSNAAAVGLFASLVGTPVAGGTWTAPGGAAFSGTYDPAVNNAGVYTYSVVGSGGCPGASATITVTEIVAPNPGTNGATSLCGSGAAVNLLAYLGGSPQAGGTWTAPGGGAFSGSYNPAVQAPGVYTYTVAGLPPCLSASATVTVTENAPPNAGSNGSATLCSNGAAISLLAYLGGAPGGGGAWTAPGGAAHTSTYDPVTDAPGVYVYTVPGIAPCANAAATVTITENLAPNVGANGALSVCSNDAVTALIAQLAGAQAGGTWTAPGGAAFGGSYNPPLDAPGVYTYSVPGTAPCAADLATVTVTESAPPNAGADGSLAICGTNLGTNLQTLLVGAQGGGTWTAPGGGPFSGVYDPAVDASGIYTYTVPGTAPCVADAATITITENAPPIAGADASLAICSTSASAALFPLLVGAQGGGTWMTPGGTPFSGTYDPATNSSGNYTYTLPGIAPCLSDAAIVTVTENAAANAGGDGTLITCSSSAAGALFPQLTGAQVGGAWTAPGGAAFSGSYDPAVDAAGIYTYTVTGAAPCPNDQSTVTVTENAPPNAGADGALTVCSNSVASALFPQLTGAQVGGAWTAPGGGAFSGSYDPAVDAAGIYTYTVTGTAPCANDQATVTVTANAAANAGADGTLITCSSSAASALLPQLTGAQVGGAWTAPGGAAFSGNYDPAVDAAGIYTYTVTGAAPCANDQATVTVTENAAPNAGADGALTVCSNSVASALFPQLTGAQVGGAWTAPGGGAFSGSYDPAVDAAGIYTYTVTGAAPCANDQATVTVTENPAPNAGADGALAICGSSVASGLFAQLTGAQAGGTWTDPGGGAFSGTYDPAVDASGIYTYSVSGAASCVADQSIVTVTETSPPNAGADGASALCSSDAVTGLFSALGGGAQPGGSWSAPGGAPHGASIDPGSDPAGAYTYTLAASGPCAADQSQVTVTISAPPNAGGDGVVAVCDQAAPVDLFAQLSGAQPGGVWTAPGGGGCSNNFDPVVQSGGVYTYTVNAPAPCGADQSIVTVIESSSPNAGTDGAIVMCSTGPVTGLFAEIAGAQAGGTWSAPGGAAHSGTLDPSVDPAGVYTYTLIASAPCVNDQSQVAVAINTAPNAGADGAVTLCDQGAPVALFASLVGAQAGGAWTAPGGAAFSGTYDPAVNSSGIYTYTLGGAAPCAADVSTVTVNETGSPNAGIDGVLALCSNAAAGDLFAQLTGAQAGGTWTAPGGAAHSASLDPAIDVAGTYTYTLAASSPCVSDQSQVSVTIDTAPNAGGDGAITVCDQGAAVGLFALLTGADAGGTWTAPGGGVFTGSYDPAVNVSGAYTYTVNGAASCAADQATVTVTETGAANAGTDGTLTLCSYDFVTDLFSALGGGAQPGGSWTAPGGGSHGTSIDPDSDPAGVYTYSVLATAPCLGDQSQVTVTIYTAAYAGIDGGLTLCDQGPPTGLFASLVGAQAGGTWTAPGGGAFSGTYDPAVDASGVFTYTVNGIAPCAADQATVTVNETGSPNAGADGSLALCANASAGDLFAALGGAQAGGTWTAPGGAAHVGTIDPSVDPEGAYTYTLNATAPCVSDQAQVAVTINAAPNAGADGAVSVCDQGGPTDLFAQLVGAQVGGAWTAPGGGAFSGSYDPALDASGLYIYTVNGMAPCLADQATVLVNETSSPNAGTDGALTICSNAQPIDLLTQLGGGAQPGGSWTAPGGAPHAAILDPTVDIGGDYTYTINGIAPCTSSSAHVTVTIEVTPNAGADGSIIACSGDGPFLLIDQLGGSPAVGGSWTDPLSGAFAGTFDPNVSLPGTYTYTVNGTVCVSDVSLVNVGVIPGPNAGQDNSIAVCDVDAPFALIGSLLGQPDPTGTWTAPDGSPFNGTLDPTTAQSGNYTYTVLAGGGACPNAQGVVNVSISNTVNAGSLSNLTLCESSAPVQLFAQLNGSPDAGGTWVDPGGAPFPGTFDPAFGAEGVYTYTVQASAPCPSASTSLNVEVNAVPHAGGDANTSICSSNGAFALATLLGGSPDTGGSWTAPNGTASNGQFFPGISASGTYTYTVAGIAPCVDDQATVTVAVSQAAVVGADGAIVVCSDDASFPLFPLLGEGTDPGGSWTTPGGLPSNGSVQPASDVSGAYTYSLAATPPCPQVQASVIVTINEVPHPEISLVMTDGCAPVEVIFSSGEEGDHAWDFGNGTTSSETVPAPVLYEESGDYVITLTVTVSAGCAATVSLAGGLSVFDRPEAAFTYGPDNLNTSAPEAYFTNQSTGATDYEWRFADLGTSTETDPHFTFPSQLDGVYTVCLTAYASENCYDTTCADIPVPMGAGLFVPNAFSPDGDGINDVFAPFVAGVKDAGYEFMVFDRWGQPLFSTTRIGEGWDGNFGDGTPTPLGVYVWKLVGRERYGTGHVDRTGHVTLVR